MIDLMLTARMMLPRALNLSLLTVMLYVMSKIGAVS